MMETISLGIKLVNLEVSVVAAEGNFQRLHGSTVDSLKSVAQGQLFAGRQITAAQNGAKSYDWQ